MGIGELRNQAVKSEAINLMFNVISNKKETKMNSEELRIALDKALALEATLTAHDELKAALNNHEGILSASLVAIQRVQDLLLHGYAVHGASTLLAKHRKVLAELVGAYNCKIVLVGDKSQACVVML